MNGRNSANSQYFSTHLQPIVPIWTSEQCLLSNYVRNSLSGRFDFPLVRRAPENHLNVWYSFCFKTNSAGILRSSRMFASFIRHR
jgi:hypothetical protein